MAKQQEPKPENVKDFIVFVSVNDYGTPPCEIYGFRGTRRRACKKAKNQFLKDYPWENKAKVFAVARDVQFGGEQVWHLDKGTPFFKPWEITNDHA